LKPEWRCPNCQSLLKWDESRHNLAKLIGVLVVVAESAVIVLLRDPLWHLLLVLGASLVLILFIFWWLESINLVEEPVDSLRALSKPPEIK